MTLRALLTFGCCAKLFGIFFYPPTLYKTEGWTSAAKSQVGGYMLEALFNVGVLALMWL